MSYTPERTWAAGDVVSTSHLNVYLRDNVDYLKGVVDGLTFSGAQADRLGSGSQSIPDATDTDVILTNELLDIGGWYSAGVFTVPAGAVPSGYTKIALQVIGAIRFVSNSTGGRSIRILKNGVEMDSLPLSAINGDTTYVNLTSFFEAAAGDTVSTVARQTSGGALNMDIAKLAVIRLSPSS